MTEQKWKSKDEYEKDVPFNDRMNTVLEGELFYCRVHTPHPAYQEKDPSMYSTILALEGKSLEDALSMGLTVYHPTETVNKHFIKLVRKLTPGKTLEEIKPDVIDSYHNPFPNNILIGNGSRALVKFTRHYTGYYTKKDSSVSGGVGARLLKIKVLDLVPYQVTFDSELGPVGGGFDISKYSGPTQSTPTKPVQEDLGQKEDEHVDIDLDDILLF